MGETWTQERPPWCPHKDCAYLRSSQAAVCIGALPAPESHDGTDNTHRFCIRGAPDDGDWTFSLKINRGDSWAMRRILAAPFTPQDPNG